MCRLSFLSCLLLVLATTPSAKAQLGDSLVINFKDGHKVTLALSEIRKITFDSLTRGVTENKPQNDLQVSLSFPNPFRNQTTIDFSLSTAGVVKISIFDVKGSIVRNLQVNAEAGKNQIIWDGLGNNGNKVSNGSFFYKIVFNNIVQFSKLEVLR